MNIVPIKTEADYSAVLAEIDRLMDAEPNTLRGDRLDVLVTLVEAYEARHWAIEPPDPIDVIKLRMQQRGLTRQDLQRILGSASGRVSEILNRRRALSVEMMRRLHAELDIPAESFMRPAKHPRPSVAKRTAKKSAPRSGKGGRTAA